jgi:hypothetical protein
MAIAESQLTTWSSQGSVKQSRDSTKLVCANYMHWLVRDNEHTSWPVANFNAYLTAAKKHWEKG